MIRNLKLTNEELIAATLEWCNTMRKRFGKELITELPKGKPGDPRSCPCGKATNLYITNYSAYTNIDQTERIAELPSLVTEFTMRFDEHKFPELIDPTTPRQING